MNPSPLVEKFFNNAVKGKALDIGCGDGQNSIFLSQQDFEVDAIDIDGNKINSLSEVAENQNLKINTEKTDVREFGFKSDEYELILAINSLFFLSGSNFKNIIGKIKKSLKSGGVVMISSFTTEDSMFKKLNNNFKSIDNQTFYDGKNNYWFFLEKNELKEMFSDFEIIFYEEFDAEDKGHQGWPDSHTHGIAQIVAKKQ